MCICRRRPFPLIPQIADDLASRSKMCTQHPTRHRSLRCLFYKVSVLALCLFPTARSPSCFVFCFVFLCRSCLYVNGHVPFHPALRLSLCHCAGSQRTLIIQWHFGYKPVPTIPLQNRPDSPL